MNELSTNTKRIKFFSLFEIAFIVVLASVPLFISFPYRVNIFLSWEGAYRMSQGQIPYRDFGMPLGYMYWVIPAIFFKIFGTQMITLVKAQVFINILSGLAFRSILKSVGVQPGIRLLSVILYCISFSFFNFWPWYNHTVIVYEMIGLAFLSKYIFAGTKHWIWLSLGALFIFFSFFTKQDGGGMAFALSFTLVCCYCFFEKKWKPLLIYVGSFLIVAFAIIAPLTKYNFGYWFNHGQPPHTSRISAFEILDEFFISSQWIKFYLLVIVLLCVAYYQKRKQAFLQRHNILFLLLTLGILGEAAVLQVTSYTPPDNNIFFHSFAFAFILYLLTGLIEFDLTKLKPLFAVAFGMFLWWSGVFWKYIQKIAERVLPKTEAKANTSGENIVNKRTYMLNADTTDIPASEWTFTGLKSFNKIYMPKPTVEGIHRLLNMDLVKQNKNLHVLNMTELTPLAVEMPYQLDKGPQIPLWYHLGVAMFNKEAKMYEQAITEKKYDLILFEHIPILNNFYPFRVRDSLLMHYHKVDSFAAPRHNDTRGTIEIYVK